MTDLERLFERYQKHGFFFESDKLTIHSRDVDGDSLLHIASAGNNVDDARIFIENGANVNSAGDMGLTPLHLAVEHSDLQIVKLLVHAGADPFIADEFGDDCIARAKFCKNTAAVKFLESQARHPKG